MKPMPELNSEAIDLGPPSRVLFAIQLEPERERIKNHCSIVAIFILAARFNEETGSDEFQLRDAGKDFTKPRYL